MGPEHVRDLLIFGAHVQNFRPWPMIGCVIWLIHWPAPHSCSSGLITYTYMYSLQSLESRGMGQGMRIVELLAKQ